MSHHRRFIVWLAAASVLSGSACVAFAQDGDDAWSRAVADKIAADLALIERYDGVLVERGIVPGAPETEVRSRVRFRAPSELTVTVLAPEAYRGDVYAHIGTTIHLYSRRLDAGIRIRNVPTVDAETRRRILRATAHHNMRTYGFQQGRDVEVADRLAIEWIVTPFEKGDLRVKQVTATDAKLALPLRTVLHRPAGEGELYRMELRELRVNEDAPDEPLAFTSGSDETLWAEWDMASTPLSLEEAAAAMDFAILDVAPDVAAADATSLKRTRIVRAETKRPKMVCTVHERAPFWAIVTQAKDLGLRDARERGVPFDLEAEVDARVSFGAVTTTIRFIRDGVDATVTTNLPLDRAVAFARSLRSASAAR